MHDKPLNNNIVNQDLKGQWEGNKKNKYLPQRQAGGLGGKYRVQKVYWYREVDNGEGIGVLKHCTLETQP